MTRKDEERLQVFEKKIVRFSQGVKKVVENKFYMMSNCEIEDILNGENVVWTINQRDFDRRDTVTEREGERIQC